MAGEGATQAEAVYRAVGTIRSVLQPFGGGDVNVQIDRVVRVANPVDPTDPVAQIRSGR